MQIFYIPDIASPLVTLPEDESKHCIKVLRMTTGETLQLVDGKGTLHSCQIVNPHPKRCEVQIIETKHEFAKRNFRLHIAIAPTKNIDRFEWFLEKATEIGIDEITPILCDHSERKNVNPERLVRVVIAAMKQSVKAYLPKLNPLTPFKTIASSSTEQQKLIAYCGNYNEPHAKNVIKESASTLFLIGPEGDFSPQEINFAQQRGFSTVGLGPSRLRTETAGVVACTLANLLNQ